MVPDNQKWKSGRISFPIFPTILVIGAIAVFAAYQFPKPVIIPSEYVLNDEDIKGTKIQESSGKTVDFVIYLSPQGTKHVLAWASDKPNTEIPVAYGEKLIGNLALSPTMDTHALHFTVSPETALTTRYVINR